MKRLIRLSACLLAVCLLVLSCPVLAAQPTITVESKQVAAGTTSVTLSFTIDNNPGLAGMMIFLEYDRALKLTDVVEGAALGNLVLTPGGDKSAHPYVLLWDALEADSSTGEFLRMTFELPQGDGTYTVNPVIRKGDAFDNNMNDLTVVTKAGVITVGSGTSDGVQLPVDPTSPNPTTNDPTPVTPTTNDPTPADPATPAAAVNPFTDVEAGKYYYDAVLWAYSHQPQVTNGTSADKFSPDMTCTRGQVVTFLWRAEGCPEPTSLANPFTDVAESAWYFKAVLWAVEKGVTNGTSADKFSPDQTCSFAHVLTFLYRVAGQPGATNTPGQPWYQDALAWAVSSKLIDDTGLAKSGDPAAACPRSDIVTCLFRNYDKK